MNKALIDAFDTVKKQQQALVSQIFLFHGHDKSALNENDLDVFDKKGLEVFQRNLKAMAQHALAISFPTVFKLIGQRYFNYAAFELLRAHPPSEGDWALWGNEFAQVLSQLPELKEYPFIADIARFDYLIHQSQTNKNNDIDLSSFQLLGEKPLDEIHIKFNQSVKLFSSIFPILQIYKMHQEEGEEDLPDKLFLENELIDANDKQSILILKSNFKTQFIQLDNREYEFINMLLQGRSIGKTLDKMHSTFDFAKWLEQALKQNIISHLKHL
ncbi:putative DNA-binding domain-containing protein [Pseudoalteromonas denitrificans]|uniref:Putative DNA-binding domain-containing protein n=1 Tax=Pseudoalteromonas denitrificans DSM 6059 TaxID=1123010 RepID=A0A1I1G577_9GAMM|nr:putative DNA-binding domain-containing protein [Pseudoalteromonas denitrificans]SFC06989.1 Putative DNA-binding domain-containing protein [Pseudoalteromonas denitrificans DSM 6059]